MITALILMMVIGIIWLSICLVWAFAKFMIWIAAAVMFFPAIILLLVTFAAV
jgi:hypothetical protein